MKTPLPKNVKLLGWVSLLNDISSETIFPLLPVFLTTVLGAGTLALGFIEGISDSISSILKLVTGAWSDRLKKKRIFILCGYGLSAALRPWMGLAPHWLMVLGIRVGDRVGKGIRTAPRDALIAASVGKNQAGHAFGFHRMMDNTGAVLGSLLAAGLITLWPGQYRWIFLSAALPGIIGFLMLTGVRETTVALETKTAAAPLVSFRTLPPRVKGFLMLLLFFTLGNATDAFLLLRLKAGGLAVALLPLLWAGLHVIKATTNSYFGKISDRMDRRRLLLMGWLFYGVVYLLFALPLSMSALIALFLGYGIFYGLTEGPERALLAEWVEPHQHGMVYGWYHTILGIALLPASLLFGLLWQRGGYPIAFGCGAAISLLTAVSWGFWLITARRREMYS